MKPQKSVRELIDSGARLDIMNNKGETSYEIIKNKHSDINKNYLETALKRNKIKAINLAISSIEDRAEFQVQKEGNVFLIHLSNSKVEIEKISTENDYDKEYVKKVLELLTAARDAENSKVYKKMNVVKWLASFIFDFNEYQTYRDIKDTQKELQKSIKDNKCDQKTLPDKSENTFKRIR